MSVSTDLTATEKTAFNDRDWTVGIKLGRDKIGRLLLGGHVRANLAQLAAPNKPHEFVPFGIRSGRGCASDTVSVSVL
jgi:hypothetical protein